MAHLSQNGDALILRVRRIIGQLQAIERALAEGADCAKTLHLTAAVRGAVNGLMDELLEDHLRSHVAPPDLSPEQREAGVEALVAAMRRYAK